LVRSAFQNRGKFYTQMATSIRCVRPGIFAAPPFTCDHSITNLLNASQCIMVCSYVIWYVIDQWSKTITVHYLSSGAANLRVSIKKQVTITQPQLVAPLLPYIVRTMLLTLS
jgi:hypothetical protein